MKPTPKLSRRAWTFTAALLIAVIALSGIAHAKMIPYVEPLDADWGGVDDPFVIEQGQYFLGVYGRLAETDDLDVIALDFARAAYNMNTSLLVPICGERFADFYPTLAIIGPGLDRPDAETAAGLPFDLSDLPEDAGVVVFPYQRFTTDQLTTTSTFSKGRPKSDWQLFDQGHYAELTFTVDIPQAGQYLFAIWSPDGESGAYTLMTGALHPEGGSFSADMDIDAVFQMVSDGSWIGWDCAE